MTLYTYWILLSYIGYNVIVVVVIVVVDIND